MMAEDAGVPIPRPPSPLTFGVALCLLIPILRQMTRFRVAEPLLEAILLLFVVRIVERKTPREYVQIALIMLAAVVVYALLSVERLFLIVCMGMGVCSSLMLMLAAWMRREPEARLSLADGKRLFMRALGMFAVMLPLCLILFFVAPRVRSPFRVPRGGWGALTGFSDELTLGDIGTIQQSGRLAFRAEVRDIAPRTPYWRGVALSYFNGTGWVVNLAGRGGGWGGPSPGGEVLRQTILMEPNIHRWLFALDRPLSVQGGEASHLGNGTFMRRLYLYSGNQIQYEALSTLTPAAGVMSERDEAVHLQLPPDYSPSIRRFMEETIRGARTDREVMDAIVARLVGGEYRWSLTGLAQGRNALEDFLLTVRQGNCEYFASAAGVMLRMAGVPARLVGGYKGGEYNRSGGYYAVRDYMAHVWVEAWDRDASVWVRLDPTPSALDGGGARGAWEDSGLWSEFWDYLDYQWNRYFVAYSGGERGQWTGVLRNIFRNPRASLSSEGLSRAGQGALGAALPVGLVLLAAAGGWTLWHYLRRDPRLALQARFERLMARRGFPRRRSEGLEEFARRLPEPLREGVMAFAFDMNAALYSGRGMDDGLRDRLVRELADLSRA